ncbi:hypothetical protein ACIQI8_36470 [Streptomyces sp. NPDC092369]|uniref:hypothetical protein n=1 Tax=Streptomyces sp. NPDC092369 TaxID=3366015 RepID=UPI003817BF5D
MARYEASRTPSEQPQNHTPPAPLTPAWLRAHFDPLPFPARMSALARYARTLTPHAYDTLHHALDTGDGDERHTALFLAVVRRDLQRVSEALADPLLGRRARAAAVRLPIPEQALARLASSDIRATRLDTYRLLRRSRRHALAAGLLPGVFDRNGPREAAELLPACPPQTVAAWLPRVEPSIGTLNSLARTAPQALAAYLAAQSDQQTRGESFAFHRSHREAATVAARRDPDAALLLLERAPDLLTERGVLAALYRPAQAAAVLRAAPPCEDRGHHERPVPGGPLPPSLRRILAESPPADLLVLAEHCPASGSRYAGPGRQEVAPDALLLLLPSVERRRIAERRTARIRLSAALAPALAALDPADRSALIKPRLKQSRRPRYSARWAMTLPLADGEPLLRELAENHRVHHRTQAWPALLACAELQGDPAEFARVAAGCERAWHDRDEVRRPALQQLAGSAPHLLAALPEQVLCDAVRTTVQSRDSTAGTLDAARTLLHRVVERAAAVGDIERAALAVALLGEVVSAPRHTGPLTPVRVDEAAARAIWATTARSTPQRSETGTAFAELLRTHLTELPDLDAQVRHIAVECDDPALAARAAAAWVWPPRLREQRCAELIALDATFATVPLVLRTVAARRTTLLDPVLAAAGGEFKGRLRARATPWTPRLRPGVTGRWLSRQREAWSEHHARVAADESAPLHVRTDATRLLGDPARLTALAERAPQPVAAAALTALGELAGRAPADAPEASTLRDLLLRHAATGGVRGRAAMAAMRRLLAHLPDEETVRLLAPVARAADAPVGTRKEAARALGSLPGDDSFEALVEAWDQPGGHPDVRAVLARALLPAVDRPGVADRLLGAVHEPAVREAVVHARVRAVPTSKRLPYTAFLVRIVEEGDDESAAATCEALPSWLGADTPDGIRVLADTVADPERSSRLWHAAARHLLRLPPVPDSEVAVRRAFDQLEERARARDPLVRTDALRRLHAIAGDVRPGVGGPRALRLLDALIDTLEAVGLSTDAAHLNWDAAMHDMSRGRDGTDRWARLARLCEAAPTRLPVPAYLPVDFGRARVREAALAAARVLGAHGTALSGQLALAFVRGGGGAAQWEEPWKGELETLRAHQDPDTAMGALLVDPDAGR